MPKRSYTLIAEHFGTDSDSIRDYEYQHGRYSKPIYCVGDDYWAAGATKPRDPDGVLTAWEKVISNYDGKSILWVCRSSDS